MFWYDENYAINNLGKETWSEQQNRIRDLWVTYDGSRPFTKMPNSSDGVAILTDPKTSWLSSSFRKKLIKTGFIGFVIVDTIYGENRLEALLDEILIL